MRNEANRPGPNDAELKPRRAKLTQSERLLRWARAGRVLDQREWFAAGADGGPPVTAVRSRIADLERRGYRFRHVLRPRQLAQYWLISGPLDEPASAHEIEDSSEQLALAPPSTTPVAAVPHWMDL
jgi:hypothetical protein